MSGAVWREGEFVWRECMSGDIEVTKAFYTAVFGWTYVGWDMGEMGMYWGIQLPGGSPFGGLMATQDGVPACWCSYVTVPDVDAAAARYVEHGGAVIHPCGDIPDTGRFAVVADPWGAVITLFRSTRGDAAAAERMAAGEFCWESLAVPDIDAAKAFYAATLGWTSTTGAGGQPLFSVPGGTAVADIEQVHGGQRPSWSTYVMVDSVEETAAKVAAAGGAVVAGPLDIPSYGRMLIVAEPGGAVLGCFEPQMG